MIHKEIWQTLSAIDCSQHVEKKNNLTYLSWAYASGHFKMIECNGRLYLTMIDGIVFERAKQGCRGI